VSDVNRDSAIAMPPLSRKCIELVGETVVRQFQPSALSAPEPINVRNWVDRQLPL